MDKDMSSSFSQFEDQIPASIAHRDQREGKTASTSSCPSCGFRKASIVRMAKGHPHYAALKCGQCDRFLDWMPTPATEGKRRDTSVKVDRLLKSPNLTRWEQNFLQGLKGKKKLSPKQQERLAKIEAKAGA